MSAFVSEGRQPRGGGSGWAHWGKGEQVREALGETDSGLLQRGRGWAPALGLPLWGRLSNATFTLTFHGAPSNPLFQQALSAG